MIIYEIKKIIYLYQIIFDHLYYLIKIEFNYYNSSKEISRYIYKDRYRILTNINN